MPQKIILKEAEGTVDLIDNKNADKVTKNSPQNNSDIYSKAEEKSINIAIDVLYIYIIHLLHDTSNQPSKIRTTYWFQVKDHSRRMCNINSQVKC